MSARRAAVAGSVWQQASPRLQRNWLIIDIAVMVALSMLTGLVLYGVFETWWVFVTVCGFSITGYLIMLLSTRLRWGIVTTSLVALAAWFLLGTPLVMPSSGIGYVIPTGRSLYGLVTAPVTAWRDMLTLMPPIGETFNLLAVPGILALLAGLLAGAISLRSDFPVLAWIPEAVSYLVAAAFGASKALFPFETGVAFVVLVVVWSSYRRSQLQSTLISQTQRTGALRLLSGLVALIAAGAITLAAVPLLSQTSNRFTLRAQMQPPIDLEQFASPLQAFRANITKNEEVALFEIEGLEPGDRVRMATLDTYDGVSYRAASTLDEIAETTTFTRVGQWIADDAPGTQSSARVRVQAYSGVWVPTVGRTTQVAFRGPRSIELTESFYYNHSSGTALALTKLESQDSYDLVFKTTSRPTDAEITLAEAGAVEQAPVTGVPDVVANLASEWTSDLTTSGEQALAIESNLRAGYFSHGQPDEAASLPGHSASRLTTLLENPQAMVGDDEQYAVTMALMARELGIPARVSYGYRMGEGTEVTGAEVAAWPELFFDGLGWVVFDPTPPKDRVLDTSNVPQEQTPEPLIENPPPPPQAPEPPPLDDDLPIEAGEPPESENPIDWARIGAWLALTGLPLLTIVIPVLLILGFKYRRRVRRQRASDPVNQAAGAWAEVVDRARDLGRSPSMAGTRSEQAEQLAASFAALAPAEPIAIAKQGDNLVFAPEMPSVEVIDQYWRDSQHLMTGMRNSVGTPRWLASWLSLRSFRNVK